MKKILGVNVNIHTNANVDFCVEETSRSPHTWNMTHSLMNRVISDGQFFETGNSEYELDSKEMYPEIVERTEFILRNSTYKVEKFIQGNHVSYSAWFKTDHLTKKEYMLIEQAILELRGV